MNKRTRHSRGQLAVIMTLAVPALIAVVAFGTDIAVLYVNWARLQGTTDTAVAAGATYLPSNPDAALATARSYARSCGIKNEEIVTTEIGANHTTISMTVTRKVSLVTRFLGFGQGDVAANSTATVSSFSREDGPPAHRLNASWKKSSLRTVS
jgi:Flp pilus assembly protein TadG